MDFFFRNRFRFQLNRIAVDVNRQIRERGTDRLAGAAADAEIDVRFGDRQADFRVAVRNHLHRLRRAVFGASAAVFVSCVNDAVFLDEDDASHLRQVFFLHFERKNRARRADFAANNAVEVAKMLERKDDARLHEAAKTVLERRRFQNFLRALRDAKMTADATFVEMFERNGSRRRDRVFALEGRLAVIRRFVRRGKLGAFGRRGGIGGIGQLYEVDGGRFVGAEDGTGGGDRRRRDAEGDKVAFAAVERRDFAANALRFARRKKGVERTSVGGLRGVRSVRVDVRGDSGFAIRPKRERVFAAGG